MTHDPACPAQGRIVTITDCRRAGFCARGSRRWFEDRGFDFRAFCREGIEAEVLWATGDAYARAVVRHVAAREANNEGDA